MPSVTSNIMKWVYNRKKRHPKQSIELQSLSTQKPIIRISPISTHKPTVTNNTRILTVVLDLDETLVHAIELEPGIDYSSFRFNTIVTNIDKQRYGVYVRPMINEFLAYCADHFELILFTAATRQYAQLVMDAIDPHGLIKYRFYRESCLESNGILTKPIQNLGRQMDRIVLVDNSEWCMLSCPDNGVLVPDFTGDPLDDDLNKLAGFLSHLHGLKDVRPFLTKTFNTRERLVRAGFIPLDSPGGPFSTRETY
jgi:Dullard-like phosphatase family protein